MSARSWSAKIFARIYADDPDPWRFETSAYEREKYAATLAGLRRRRFRAGLEVGCSIGVLSRQLAGRCDRLLAVDVADAALAEAAWRCRGLPVRVERRAVPAEWPSGRFDLIVLSEILYFLGPVDIARTARRAAASLRPGGVVVVVNWTGLTNTPCSGEQAATLFLRHATSLRARRAPRRRPGYRLDVLHKPASGVPF